MNSTPVEHTHATRRQTAEAVGRVLLTGTLAGSLACTVGAVPMLAHPAAAFAQEAAQAAAGGAGPKDETVYIRTAPDGSVTGIYVVNKFELTGSARIADPGSYASVENLSTTDALSQEDGSVVADVQGTGPFYYQGDLDPATALPWGVRVSYRLDGEPVDASALAGASGELQIELAVDGNGGDANLADFAGSCVVQAQATFDEERFELTDAGGTTAAHAGGDTVLTAMVLPGEDATFTITAQVRDFSYDGWQITAMPLSMAIDVSAEASGLSEQTGELEQATSSLATGSGSLAEALSTLSDGAGALDAGAASAADGAARLAGGAASVQGGADELASGARDLASGAASAADGAARLASGIDTVSAGASKLDAQGESLAEAVSSLDEGARGLQQGASRVSGGASQLAAGIASAYDGVAGSAGELADAQAGYAQAFGDLQAALEGGDVAAAADAAARVDAAARAMAQASGAAGAEQALGGLVGGAQDLASGAEELTEGASRLAEGTAGLAEGVGAYRAGVGALAGGIDSVAAGASDLNAGAAALADGASGAAAGAERLAAGAGDVADGAQELEDGTATLADGTDALAVGAAQAHAGSLGLSEGAARLADACAGLDGKVLEQLQRQIDEKLGAGFTPHSFVDPANTEVGRVQFTYVVDGVSEPEAPAAPERQPAQESFLDRLLAVFR